MENSETSGWLDFALASHYITNETFSVLMKKNEEIGKMPGHMMKNPEKY